MQHAADKRNESTPIPTIHLLTDLARGDTGWIPAVLKRTHQEQAAEGRHTGHCTRLLALQCILLNEARNAGLWDTRLQSALYNNIGHPYRTCKHSARYNSHCEHCNLSLSTYSNLLRSPPVTVAAGSGLPEQSAQLCCTCVGTLHIADPNSRHRCFSCRGAPRSCQ